MNGLNAWIDIHKTFTVSGQCQQNTQMDVIMMVVGCGGGVVALVSGGGVCDWKVMAGRG